MGVWVGGGCVVVGHVAGSVVGEWVAMLLVRWGWRWPLREARARAQRCVENTRMRGGAKPEPGHGAEPIIPVNIKHVEPSVGGWVVGVRVVVGGRMCGRWVDGWAVGVLWLGRRVARWLVSGWVGYWRGGVGGGLCVELEPAHGAVPKLPECAALSLSKRTALGRPYTHISSRHSQAWVGGWWVVCGW
jgi:hypothetical protein